MNFYNEKTKQILTEKNIKALGLSENDDLTDVGIYPIVYNYIDVPETYKMVPDKLIKKQDHYERTFKLEDVDLSAAKEMFINKVSEMRWKAEVKGIVVDGINVSTDRDSQAKISQTISGLNLISEQEQLQTIKFKTSNGFIDISIEQFKKIGIAVTKYIEKCYEHEAELYNKINSVNDVQTLRKIEINFDV